MPELGDQLLYAVFWSGFAGSESGHYDLYLPFQYDGVHRPALVLSLINDDNIDQHKALIQEHRDYSHYLTQEYYPLTAFSEEETAWMAWQYNDASDSTGIIQVFKRTESTQTEDTYFLSGLQADTLYRVEDIDTGDYVEMTGEELWVQRNQDYAAGRFRSGNLPLYASGTVRRKCNTADNSVRRIFFLQSAYKAFSYVHMI